MIEIRNASFAYHGQTVLESLSCALPDGQITAIAGPNGAGKSTLLRLCARLLKPASGTVLVGGQDAAVCEPRAFARMLAFLPQSRPLPQITVRSLVMHGRYAHMGLRPSDRDREAVRRALEIAGLDALADRPLPTLSGGQRQLAYIAMLMAQEAQHILLDEPLTFLDAGAQLDVMHLLQTLRGEGRCIGVVLHDLPMVERFSDHVLLLDQGRLLSDGPRLDDSAVERAFGVRRDGAVWERIPSRP